MGAEVTFWKLMWCHYFHCFQVSEVDHHERQVEEAQQKGLSLTDGDKVLMKRERATI